MLCLNHKLFQFRVSETSLCLYFDQHYETAQHLSAIATKLFHYGQNSKKTFVKRNGHTKQKRENAPVKLYFNNRGIETVDFI